MDGDILAYSTLFFASEPEKFADISDIVIQQFKESQELKNPVLFFFAHTVGAAAPRAPAVSKEDSRPQAILKFRAPSSLDYKACHGPQTRFKVI